MQILKEPEELLSPLAGLITSGNCQVVGFLLRSSRWSFGNFKRCVLNFFARALGGPVVDGFEGRRCSRVRLAAPERISENDLLPRQKTVFS